MKNIITITAVVLLTSCGSWDKYDKEKFMEACQQQKLSDKFCDCALEKALNQYSTFDEMTADEENMANLLYTCIEEEHKAIEDKK